MKDVTRSIDAHRRSFWGIFVRLAIVASLVAIPFVLMSGADADLFGGLLFFIGAIACSYEVYAIRRDKRLAGTDEMPTLYFLVLGGYYTWFFYDQGFYWSAAGELALFLVNAVWVAHVWYYRYFAQELEKALDVH